MYISSLQLATIVTIICFTALLETSNSQIILELGPDWFFYEVDADVGFPLDSVLCISTMNIVNMMVDATDSLSLNKVDSFISAGSHLVRFNCKLSWLVVQIF